VKTVVEHYSTMTTNQSTNRLLHEHLTMNIQLDSDSMDTMTLDVSNYVHYTEFRSTICRYSDLINTIYDPKQFVFKQKVSNTNLS